MSELLTLIRVGDTPRMGSLLYKALAGIPYEEASPQNQALHNRRILFVVGIDNQGPGTDFYRLVRWLRRWTNSLTGSVAGIVVDGRGELYTKQAAQTLVMAANLAGCAFLGKPLVEGTGSLYNQHILAKRLGVSWEATYFRRVRELAQRVLAFTPPTFARPRLLMIHASDNRRSNTVWIGRQVLQKLTSPFSFREVSLQRDHSRLPRVLLYFLPPLCPAAHLLLWRCHLHRDHPSYRKL